MSRRTTSKASRNAISSPGLEFGHSHFVALDGTIRDQSGQPVARASLSARQALKLHLRTQDTYGQAYPGSSESADLQLSLENRLQALLSGLGSTLYTLTWKKWVTPSGLLRFRLRASVRPISETGLIGVPTPSALVVDAKPSAPIIGSRKPTDPQIGLADIAVHLWPDLGQMQNGLNARTGERARLSPEWPRWLMDLPEGWSSCAPTETLSMLKRRKSLSNA